MNFLHIKNRNSKDITIYTLKNVTFYEINVTKDVESAKMTYEEIIKNEIK